MGFKNTQWADKKAGFNPKEELDKAHLEKMVEITMNWKVVSEGHSDLNCSKVGFCHCFIKKAINIIRGNFKHNIDYIFI